MASPSYAHAPIKKSDDLVSDTLQKDSAVPLVGLGEKRKFRLARMRKEQRMNWR